MTDDLVTIHALVIMEAAKPLLSRMLPEAEAGVVIFRNDVVICKT